MGIRICIKWDVVSPALQIAVGVVSVYDIPAITSKPQLLFRCNCKIEQYSTGFSAISEDEGIPSNLFNVLDEHIKLMMRSYFDGMRLEKDIFHWVNDTLDESFNLQQWIDEYNLKNKQ